MAPDKLDVAEYIREICAELRGMAEEAGLPVLAHLLALTELQAERERDKDGL